MEWTPGDMSSDIEDRRGDSDGGGGGGFGFGGGGMGGGIGLGGLVLLIIISLVTGHNFLSGLFGGGGAPVQQTQPMEQNGPVQQSA